MDSEMDAIADNSPNLLVIPELLDNILGFLPVKDLKNCRLVNKFWKDTALKPMRKNCAKITFGRRTKTHHGLEGMEKFLQCFSAQSADWGSGLLSCDPEILDDIPCTKFEVYTNIIYKRSSDREKSIAANFLQAISPWATEIVLQGGRDIGRFLKGVEKLKFPSLKHVVFGVDLGFGSGAFSAWMSVFITNSPQLQKLELDSRSAEQSFFQFLLQNKGLKIKELSIHAIIENNDLLVLIECDLKLKSLALHCKTGWTEREPISITTLPLLLKSQSENLEKFSISDFYGCVAEGVSFPFMKKLKQLTTRGKYPGLINYATQTPALEKIVDKSDRPGYLNGEMNPAPSVKKFCFGWTHPTAEGILEMGRIFPNIRKLELTSYEDSLPIVYNSLPNLEELTLSTCDNIDVLLTGLTKKGYRQAVRRLGNWTRDFDDSDIQIALKLLRLKRMFRARNGKWEITQVSFCLAFMKMPSLQILDVCERPEAPDKVIPCEVLKEFRKNCVILCKTANNRV